MKAHYYEGGLISHKLTGYAGAAKLVDAIMQVRVIITSNEGLFVPSFICNILHNTRLSVNFKS